MPVCSHFLLRGPDLAPSCPLHLAACQTLGQQWPWKRPSSSLCSGFPSENCNSLATLSRPEPYRFPMDSTRYADRPAQDRAILFVCLFMFFPRRVSLCSSGYIRTRSIDQAGLCLLSSGTLWRDPVFKKKSKQTKPCPEASCYCAPLDSQHQGNTDRQIWDLFWLATSESLVS